MWLFVGRIDKPARKMEVLEFAVKFCLTSAHETERQSSLRWLVLCRLLRYFYFPLTSPFAFHPSLLRWRKCCRSKSKRTMNQAVMSIDSFFFTFRKCRWGGGRCRTDAEYILACYMARGPYSVLLIWRRLVWSGDSSNRQITRWRRKWKTHWFYPMIKLNLFFGFVF
jgi:hypothetical protein